jgi:hypothetical protein
MFTKLKTVFGRLAGESAGNKSPQSAEPVEYKGYRIIPTPYRAGEGYQTAGTIEKDTADGIKRHEFIRADTYNTMDDAVAFTTSKAKQMIDLQGDRIFK